MGCWLACLYLSGGLAVMGSHHADVPGQYWLYDYNRVENPFGVAEIGWSRQLGRWDFEIAARHISSIAVDIHAGGFQDQYGTNTFEARLRWYPWR